MTSSSDHSCCDEYAAVSRRGLLAGALALAGTSTLVGSAVVRASAATVAPAPAVLVVLSLRGAADGLSLVVPHADPAYYRARPRLAVPSDRLLAKDGMFGLHPKLAPLMPLWSTGRLAAVQATGMAAPNRSHFAAMEEVEDANPGSTSRVGWLNRLIDADAITSPLQGFSVGGGAMPTSLYGPADVISAREVDDVELYGSDNDPSGRRRRSIETLWAGNTTVLGRAMRSSLATIDGFAPVHQAQAPPTNGATYPDGDLGESLALAARVIRGDVGVAVLTVDQGDWDMHTGLGNADSGRMARNAADLAGSIAAFFTDLGPLAEKVTLVTISEFGRRVVENANRGLDHGHGTVMFAMGGGVKGGYYGRWPGLTNTTDADLTVTTDYRSVLNEVVTRRLNASTAQVFPGLAPKDHGFITTL